LAAKPLWPKALFLTTKEIFMARTTTSTTKEKLSKGAIAKIAEETAKKTIKKESGKIARKEATKVAAKVATEAALNPDYDLNEDEDYMEASDSGWEDEEEEYERSYSPSSLFSNYSSSSKSYADDDSDDDESDNDIDLSKDIKNRDIFAYANDLMNKGTPVRLQIKKNGQFLTTIKKPYSEELLQKDYGEGHYAVILRNDVKGTFIKQQSFSIAAPPMPVAAEMVKIHQEKQEEKIDRMFQTFSEMQSAQTDSQQQLFERLLEEQRRREDEEKERRKEERELMKYQESNNTNMIATVLQAALSNKGDDSGGVSAILQIMQSQQNQTTQMIMESNKNFMMMVQEMRRDTQQMMDKMTHMSQEQSREFRAQIAEMAGKKQDGFDPIQMFKMLNDTRESGMNFGLKINELAKQIAESDIKPSEPKGIVESVLDNIGKLAPLMISAAQNNQASQHFAPQAPVQAVPAQATVVQPTQPAQPRKHTINATPTTPKIIKSTVQGTPANSSVIKSTVAPSRPVVATPRPAVQAQSGVAATNTNSVANKQETAKIDSGMGLKEKVIEICVPLIGHALSNNINSGGLGDATLNAFAAQGIDPASAVKVVTVEDIYELAFKKFSLPDVPELRHYLKDYHDYLSLRASTTQSGATARSGN